MLSKAKQWLKKYFIPHEDNDYRPHILRAEAVLFTLTLVLVVEAAFAVYVFILFPRANLLASILNSVLVDETNSSRVTENLSQLHTNPLLGLAAEEKARDMASKGYFAHVSPDGVSPWYWFGAVGYNFSYAGENLAVNFFDSQDVINAWMNSPEHRANILNNHFTEIGIGTARGIYEGREAIFVVQLFGRPAEIRTSAVADSAPPVQSELKEVAVIQSTTSPEMFLAVQSPEVKGISTGEGGGTEAGANANANVPASSNLVGRILFSPRAMTNYLYLIILTIISLAIALKLFVRMESSHAHLIANGVLLLILIVSALMVNQFAITQARIF